MSKKQKAKSKKRTTLNQRETTAKETKVKVEPCARFNLDFGFLGRGFTLIEILVAITLFTVIMIASVGSLISINNANRKTQAMRAAIDNVNFALDTIARRLRTGKEYMCMNPSDTRPSTLIPTGCPSGQNAIAFRAADNLDGGPLGDIIVYRLNNKRIEESNRPDGGDYSAYSAMTASEVEIDELRFIVMGAGASDGLQPYVLITVRGSVETGKRLASGSAQKTEFKVQTTVSQRLLE